MITFKEYKDILDKLENQIVPPPVNAPERVFWSMSVAAVLLDHVSANKEEKELFYQDAKKRYIDDFKGQMN